MDTLSASGPPPPADPHAHLRPWVVKPFGAPTPAPGSVALRLFCFPPAGQGAHVFHAWQAAMPPGVELMPVELPGKGLRLRERRSTDMDDLVRRALDGLGPLLGLGGGSGTPPQPPFAFLGYSMGAWVAAAAAWELARRRREASSSGAAPAPLPAKLYACAARAPALAGAAHDADGVAMAGLPDGEFWAAMARRYGRNAALEAPGARALAAPALRADFAVVEGWRPAQARDGAAAARLPCALAVLAGRQDPRYAPAQVAAWAQHAPLQGGGGDGGAGPRPTYEECWFDGAHGFVTGEARAEVAAWLAADLARVAVALAARASAGEGGGGGGGEPPRLAAPAGEAMQRARGGAGAPRAAPPPPARRCAGCW